jgi:hypothetical protein
MQSRDLEAGILASKQKEFVIAKEDKMQSLQNIVHIKRAKSSKKWFTVAKVMQFPSFYTYDAAGSYIFLKENQLIYLHL